MKPFPSRVHAPLLAAIRRVLVPVMSSPSLVIIIEAVRSEDWASLTFIGEKHWLELRVEGDAATVAAARTRLATALDDIDFDIAGHIVADISLTSAAQVNVGDLTSCRVRFEVLTIVD